MIATGLLVQIHQGTRDHSETLSHHHQCQLNGGSILQRVNGIMIMESRLKRLLMQIQVTFVPQSMLVVMKQIGLLENFLESLLLLEENIQLEGWFITMKR